MINMLESFCKLVRSWKKCYWIQYSWYWNVNIFTHFGSFCETSRRFDLSSRSLGHVIFSREKITWPRLLDERSKRREVSQNDPKWVKIVRCCMSAAGVPTVWCLRDFTAASGCYRSWSGRMMMAVSMVGFVQGDFVKSRTSSWRLSMVGFVQGDFVKSRTRSGRGGGFVNSSTVVNVDFVWKIGLVQRDFVKSMNNWGGVGDFVKSRTSLREFVKIALFQGTLWKVGLVQWDFVKSWTVVQGDFVKSWTVGPSSGGRC